jgi:hypothetical protein
MGRLKLRTLLLPSLELQLHSFITLPQLLVRRPEFLQLSTLLSEGVGLCRQSVAAFLSLVSASTLFGNLLSHLLELSACCLPRLPFLFEFPLRLQQLSRDLGLALLLLDKQVLRKAIISTWAYWLHPMCYLRIHRSRRHLRASARLPWQTTTRSRDSLALLAVAELQAELNTRCRVKSSRIISGFYERREGDHVIHGQPVAHALCDLRLVHIAAIGAAILNLWCFAAAAVENAVLATDGDVFTYDAIARTAADGYCAFSRQRERWFCRSMHRPEIPSHLNQLNSCF